MNVKQALLLVGGRGTRMWPLTAHVPKGLVPVAGLPFLDLQIRQLAEAGIGDVLLAVGQHHLAAWEEYAAGREGVRLVVEEEPLDTAGPVVEALATLDDRFLVLNGDVVVESDLAGFLSAAPDGAGGVLGLVEVDDPSDYGVVVLDEGGAVERFVEKPPRDQAPARTVNAGMYVLSKSALEPYSPGPLSFERVVFPDLASQGALSGKVVEGRWLDIGTPRLYLECTGTALLGATDLHRPDGPHLVEGSSKGTSAGAWSWVGEDSTVASGAVIEESVVLPGAEIGAGAVVQQSVVGWRARIGPETRVAGASLIGAGATVGAGCELDHGVRIRPDAELAPGDVTFAPPN